MERTFIRLTMVLVVLSFSVFAVGIQEVDLERKYADIFGKWELNLSDVKMGAVSLECYIENGSIWMAPPSDPPFKLVLVEGEEWKFEVEGDSNWRFEFMKDDNGKYHMCKVVNRAQEIDTTAKKIEKQNDC